MRKSNDCDPDEYGQAADPTTTFVDDRWPAQQIGMKPGTIRSQRFKRLHGQDHWFDVDPVYIGSKPRYRLYDVLTWLKRQGRTTNTSGSNG